MRYRICISKRLSGDITVLSLRLALCSGSSAESLNTGLTEDFHSSSCFQPKRTVSQRKFFYILIEKHAHWLSMHLKALKKWLDF